MFDIEALYNCKFSKMFFPYKKDSVKAKLVAMDSDLYVGSKLGHGSSTSEYL